MAERHVVVGVVVELLGHDDGHWCRVCALSTGARAWLVVRSSTRMHMQTRVWCVECGSRDIVLDT